MSKFIFQILHRPSLLLNGVALLLMSCAPPTKVAVEERQIITAKIEAERIGGNHIRFAEPGDTLYSIAFINGLNVNELAAWNGMADISKLSEGQRIRLTQPIGFVAPVLSEQQTVEENVVSQPLLDRPITASPIEPAQTVVNIANEPALEIKPKLTEPETIKPPLIAAGDEPTNAERLSWSWPTQGKVITQFSNSIGQQGIDIQGRVGQPVLATGAGDVVYVGDGLKGYGNLVIIKHDDQFLSAYAHNQEIFVMEGEQIRAKQRIAALGQNNRRQNALHFQIRKDGQPVDPLKYISR